MTNASDHSTDLSERNRALLMLIAMPLFFSSNIIFGRAAIAEVEPFTLAFLRWTSTCLILLPFVLPVLRSEWLNIKAMTGSILVMGFLGMWICGALVYLALKYTTATNGTLIYTSSPVMIILIEWLYRGRKVGAREAFGIGVAFVGVVVIVTKGTFSTLTNLQFNAGDLLFVAAALSWAVYSVGLKSERFNSLQTLPLFALIAGSGALLLAPFTLVEILWFQTFPSTTTAWANIGGIVAIASLLAFSTFQYGVKIVGASLTGVYMYLLPVYGVGLAVLFLGETLAAYHGWGILLVLSGVVMATLPAKLFPGN